MTSQKVTDPGPTPLLFSFRGVRGLQIIVAIAAGSIAIGGVVMLKAYTDGGPVWLVLLAVVFVMLFIWMFGIALRLPTSFVAISQDKMRIRFAGFVDTIVETRQVEGARLVQWKLWQGLGVRAGSGGGVALVSAWGPVAEVTLKQPIGVWVIPRIWRIKATRVALSVRNPSKLADRFGPVPTASTAPISKKKRR
ncbi:MAG: hypothetical protein ABI577_16000 [bacterium]